MSRHHPRNGKRAKRPLACALALAAVLLAGGLAASALAQDVADLVLVSNYVPPNVMILLDNSDQMNHHLWDDDFNPDKLYPALDPNCATFSALPPMIAGSSCPGLGNPGDLCPNNEWVLEDEKKGGEIKEPHRLSGSAVRVHTECGVSRLQYHDASTVPQTRYSLNYMNWLYGVATDADLVDEPQETRIQAAKRVLLQVIDRINIPDPNTGEPLVKLRFGYAQYGADPKAEGGRIDQAINDSSTTAVKAGIAGTQANALWSPLSETLIDLGRYFAGGDGLGTFPLDTAKSPIDVRCRKSFAIVISSGLPTKDLHDHWPLAFASEVGNYDGDANECSLAAPATCTDAPSTGRDDSLVYIDEGSDWLDDVAGYLYDTDLRSSLPGLQNLITYTIGFANEHPLLRETAAAGDGLYFNTGGSSANQLARSIEAAMLDIIERASSFTAVSVPSARTSFGDGFYTARFTPFEVNPFWEGHLEAYRLAQDGTILDASEQPALDPNGQFPDPRNPFWDAGEVLLTNPSRNLFTSTPSDVRLDFNTTNVTATELALDPNDALMLPFYPNYPASGVDTLAELATAVVNYVVGEDAFDEDLDNDWGELRDWILSDIFHSSPLVIGPPKRTFRNEEGYENYPAGTPFVDQFASRDRIIYVGSNGGMLHAFHAGGFNSGDNPLTPAVEDGYYDMGTGEELFGYVPRQVLPQLKMMPINNPRSTYYVDGPLAAADVWMGDPMDPNDVSKEPDEWATVLLAGLRQGGPAYVALDVTDPTATLPPHGPYPRLLGEFTDPRLGDTWSQPVITRIKHRGALGLGDHCGKDDGDGDCQERWVAIFGAGYRKDADPGSFSYVSSPADPNWSDASKGIFMISLHTGQLLGSVVHDASGLNGSPAMRYAVPSDPAVLDLDFDGFADVVYIGDTGGQMWKWDISQIAEDVDGDGEVDNWSAGVFFRSDPADLGGGAVHYRSFFFPPSAAFHNGQLYLAFATGERNDPKYPGVSTKDENNRFYVVKDANPTGVAAFPFTLTEANLTDLGSGDSDTNPLDAGYYMVVADGEKFVSKPLIFAGQVIGVSYTPDFVSPDLCARGGDSHLYIFDLQSGLGYFADALTSGMAARRLALGSGMSNEPRISISAYGDKMYIQTQDSGIVQIDPPDRDNKIVELIYWRQNF